MRTYAFSQPTVHLVVVGAPCFSPLLWMGREWSPHQIQPHLHWRKQQTKLATMCHLMDSPLYGNSTFRLQHECSGPMMASGEITLSTM